MGNGVGVALSRILIFAEAVTLAHVARPIALSRVLRKLGHEVCIAAAPAADRWLAGEAVARQSIDSISPARFLRALARGTPVYDAATLRRYVEDDLRAIAAWPPDVVVGDFRLSLYISARRAGRPYGAIANAYWSRRYWTGVDAPAVPPLTWLPGRAATALFRAVYPAVFALHAMPFHRACKSFGVKPPGLDIRDVYTASDLTAFADVAALYEPSPAAADAPPFIGPLAWEPVATDPLPAFPDGPPIVFVSLGSSGPGELLPKVLEALAGLPVRCIVATGADAGTSGLPANCIYSAEFVPYAAACEAATVVVCNGGAPATYAALARGRPVLGIVHNLDQALNMRTVARMRAGTAVAPGGLRGGGFAAAISRLLVGREAVASAALASRGIFELAGRAHPEAEWIRRLLKGQAVGYST